MCHCFPCSILFHQSFSSIWPSSLQGSFEGRQHSAYAFTVNCYQLLAYHGKCHDLLQLLWSCHACGWDGATDKASLELMGGEGCGNEEGQGRLPEHAEKAQYCHKEDWNDVCWGIAIITFWIFNMMFWYSLCYRKRGSNTRGGWITGSTSSVRWWGQRATDEGGSSGSSHSRRSSSNKGK